MCARALALQASFSGGECGAGLPGGPPSQQNMRSPSCPGTVPLPLPAAPHAAMGTKRPHPVSSSSAGSPQGGASAAAALASSLQLRQQQADMGSSSGGGSSSGALNLQHQASASSAAAAAAAAAVRAAAANNNSAAAAPPTTPPPSPPVFPPSSLPSFSAAADSLHVHELHRQLQQPQQPPSLAAYDLRAFQQQQQSTTAAAVAELGSCVSTNLHGSSTPLLHQHLRHHQLQQQLSEIGPGSPGSHAALGAFPHGLHPNSSGIPTEGPVASAFSHQPLPSPTVPHIPPLSSPELYLTSSGRLHQMLPFNHLGHPSSCLSPSKVTGAPPSPINSGATASTSLKSPPARPLLRRGGSSGSSASVSSPKMLHSPKVHSPKVHGPPPPLPLPYPHMYFQPVHGGHLGAAPGPMTSLPHHSMLMPPPRQVGGSYFVHSILFDRSI
eukprot:575708-Pelagomonas_calceolata.AAC.4